MNIKLKKVNFHKDILYITSLELWPLLPLYQFEFRSQILTRCLEKVTYKMGRSDFAWGHESKNFTIQ